MGVTATGVCCLKRGVQKVEVTKGESGREEEGAERLQFLVTVSVEAVGNADGAFALKPPREGVEALRF